jgi:hypothetical protein
MEAKGRARVRGQADGGTDLGERDIRILQEMGMGRRGEGQRERGVKSPWDGAAEGELHVVEEVDVESSNWGGGRSQSGQHAGRREREGSGRPWGVGRLESGSA